jgi:hypothetical protein
MEESRVDFHLPVDADCENSGFHLMNYEPSAGVTKFSLSFNGFRKPELGNCAFPDVCWYVYHLCLVVRIPGYRSRVPGSIHGVTEELLERKSSGSCLENRDYGRRDPSRWPRGTLYPQKLTLTSPTSCGRSIGIVHSRTQATEFSFYYLHTRNSFLKLCHVFLKHMCLCYDKGNIECFATG